MLRQNNEAVSPFVYLALSQTGIDVSYTEGGDPNNIAHVSGSQTTTPTWLKLERKEGSVLAYESDDGITFSLITTITLALSTSFNFGLTTSTTNNLVQTQFDEVMLQQNNDENDLTVIETLGPDGGRISVNFLGELREVVFPAGVLSTETDITVTLSSTPDTNYPDRDSFFYDTYDTSLLDYIGPNLAVEVPYSSLVIPEDDDFALIFAISVGFFADEPRPGAVTRMETRTRLPSGEDVLGFESLEIAEVIAGDLLFTYQDGAPSTVRVSFQMVDERGFASGSNTSELTNLNTIDNIPFSDFEEGVFKLDDQYQQSLVGCAERTLTL